MNAQQIPPLPEGFVLDMPQGQAAMPQGQAAIPPLPEGFVLDTPQAAATSVQDQTTFTSLIASGLNDIADSQKRERQRGFQISEMASNVLPSALKFAKDMTYPIIHPIQTATAIKTLVQGVGDKMGFDLGEGDQSIYVDAVVEELKNRYGGINEITQTLESDPVGLASDVAGIFMTGGSMTGLQSLNRIGQAIDPIKATARVAKQVGSKIAQKLDANDMYQEIVKFAPGASQLDRSQWAQVGLDEGVVSGSDISGKYSSKLDDLTSRLNTMIDDVSDGTEAIPVERVLSGLDELKKEKGGFLIDAESDVNAINAFKESFLDVNFGRETVTPRQLQDFKTDAYNKIDFLRNYKQGSPIDVDIRKNVGRAAKEGIEEVLPEVKAINTELGNLLDAKDPLTRAWNRIDNRNKIGLIQSIFTAGGVAAGGGIQGGAGGLLVGGALSWLLSPKVKAQFAVVLNELAKNGGDARLIDSALIKGLTKQQMQQLTKLSGRLAQVDVPEDGQDDR